MTSTRPDLRGSWLGSLPAGWDVLEPRRLFRLRRQPERPDDVHLTPSQRFGVLAQAKYMELTGSRVVLNLSGTAMQHVEAGDFISHLRTFQGGLELARTAGKVSPAYTVVAPRPGVEPEFFKYVLKSRGYVSQIASLTDQLRDGQAMRFTEFNKTSLPVPPLSEQRAIADYLDHETAEIDAFISDQERLRKLVLERVATSRVWHFAPPTGKRARIRQIARIVNGSGFPVEEQGKTGLELPVFKVGSLGSAAQGLLSFSANTVSEATASRLGARVIPSGTVIMAKIGAALYLNRNAVLHRPSCIDNNLMGLVPRQTVNSEFLQQLLMTLDLKPLGNPGAVPSLNLDWFKDLEVWLPDLETQERIIRQFKSEKGEIDSLVADLERAQRLSHERRAALISAALTGQVDVAQRHKPVAEQLEEEVLKKP